MKKRVSTLQEARVMTDARIDELNNKIILLNEKIEASRGDSSGTGGASLAPPEGLKVVSLGEEDRSPRQIIVRPSTVELRPSRSPEQGQPPKAAAPVAPPRKAAPTTASAFEPATADELYARGRDEFLSGLYSSARLTFTRLEKEYPGHSLADNALYWVGESYYTQKEFDKALEFFDKTADKYPEGNKAPDALLKAGYSCVELGRTDDAVARLQAAVDRYPGTEAAEKAAIRLVVLK